MRKRNNRVWVRLNDEEFSELTQKIKQSGYPREVFIRKVLKEAIVREAPPADYPKLLRALSQIGNNLNQIAATANTIHFINPKELKAATADLKHTMQQIHHAFQIPDQKRLQAQIISQLQYIYQETKKALNSMNREPTDKETLQFIQNAVAEKVQTENAALREYRDTHPTMLLGALSEWYIPFQERKEDA